MVETTNVAENRETGNPEVRVCEIVRTSGSCGFNLTKSKWDPYPWVSTVESGSPAEMAGVQAGDCLLEVNGEDILGLRVKEVANRVKASNETVTVMLWNSGVDPTCTPEALCCGPMPTNLQRLSNCMSNILAALECPICMDTIPPPAHQCANGHLICINCRVRTERCPVCRMKFFRGRSLLADQVFNSLILAFDLVDKEESKRAQMLRQRICGNNRIKKAPEIKINFLSSPTNKLLTRLLGSRKASSAENLSNTDQTDNKLSAPTEDSLYSSLRAKSLSSNEIFNPEGSTISKTPSILMTRPGSGLLDVRQLTYPKRPASYHGSSENLSSRIQMDFGNDIAKDNNFTKCYCPFDADCEQIWTNEVMQHLQMCHEGPILHFYKPKIYLDIPLSFTNPAILVTAYGQLFIVQLIDLTRLKESQKLCILSVNDGKCYAIVTLKEKNGQTSNHCQILSLTSFSWKQIVNENCGLTINLKNNKYRLEIEIIKTD